MDAAAAECARKYYRTLDEHDYDAFDGLLAPGFVHDRPDRTFDGRERFVRFMREERPNRDTTHRIEGIYRPAFESDSGSGPDGDAEPEPVGRSGDGEEPDVADVAVQGHLVDEGDVLFEFVDLFDVADGRIERVDTYARSV